MKLLFLTPQLPYPPRQGTTLRNYSLIRYLAAGHTVHLFSLLAPGEGLAPDSPLHHLCPRIELSPQPQRSLRQRAFDTLTSLQPDMALRLATPEAQNQIQAMLAAERYDIVQAEGIEMAGYVLRALHSDRPRQFRFVFDDHNAEYLLQRRAALVDLTRPRRWLAALYSLAQWAKLRRYERAICLQADAVVAVSQPDRQALCRLAPGIDPAVVPNGIDLAAYGPYPQATHQPPHLVFTGKMDYRPNVDAVLWFGQAVLPLVRVQIPDVRFQIVGMNPHPRLAALHADPAVTITGAVDDPRPYIRGAAVYVVPMRVGGGTRFKVLEAMACGKAIVSTALGVEGIPVQDGRELLIADEPAAFAAAVVELLRDQQQGGGRGRALGEAAYQFVRTHYTWEWIIPRLQHLYEQIQ